MYVHTIHLCSAIFVTAVNILIEELRVPVETVRVNRSCSCRSGLVQTVTVLVKLFIEGTKWLKRPCDIVKC
jgi:hypothetical protein